MKNNRFVFLDGIRGIASLFVLTRHTNSFWNLEIHRCYLAVDIFFILSGYVIAHAYDKKIITKSIEKKDFILIRLIRLYPVFLLSLVGCIAVLIQTGTAFDSENIKNTFAVIALTSIFIPLHFHGEKALFPLNGPYWSLFYELVGNLIYVIIRPVLTNIILLLIVVISGVLLAIVSYAHQNLDAGFFFSTKSFIAGFTRSIFGIFAGLLLHRHHELLQKSFLKNISPWVSIFIVTITLLIPNANHFNWIIDLGVVIFIYPICVIIGSNNAATRFEWFLLALGSASYPIYVLHKPFGDFISNLVHENERLYSPYSGILLTIILILTSMLIEKYYDIPLRKKINQIRLKYK